jgi:hypothetical protein
MPAGQSPGVGGEPAPGTFNQQKPRTLQEIANDMDRSTGTAKTKNDDKCGPYPGYPCGTRYYTVGAGDFKRIIRAS